MDSVLKAAYTLISDFKRGVYAKEAVISEEQQRLIHTLSEDLQVQKENLDIGQLIQQIAKIDSIWNKRTMAVIDRFYTLRESGRLAEAEHERSTFNQQCPSAWYRGIVNKL